MLLPILYEIVLIYIYKLYDHFFADKFQTFIPDLKCGTVIPHPQP
jgi:hypothetical protein